jgi:hypothetical protein
MVWIRATSKQRSDRCRIASSGCVPEEAAELRSTHAGRRGRFCRPLVVQRSVFAGHIRNHGSNPLLASE